VLAQHTLPVRGALTQGRTWPCPRSSTSCCAFTPVQSTIIAPWLPHSSRHSPGGTLLSTLATWVPVPLISIFVGLQNSLVHKQVSKTQPGQDRCQQQGLNAEPCLAKLAAGTWDMWQHKQQAVATSSTLGTLVAAQHTVPISAAAK
jgi:hypothetical protein